MLLKTLHERKPPNYRQCCCFSELRCKERSARPVNYKDDRESRDLGTRILAPEWSVPTTNLTWPSQPLLISKASSSPGSVRSMASRRSAALLLDVGTSASSRSSLRSHTQLQARRGIPMAGTQACTCTSGLQSRPMSSSAASPPSASSEVTNQADLLR